jgi:LPS export ABC transporter protein LptC
MALKKMAMKLLKCLKELKLIFYNKEGIIESFLTAKKGISYQAQKITEVSEDVVVRNNKGEKLNTELLTWDQNKQLIYTDKFVKITTEKEIITGDGLIGKQDFSEWTIKKPRGIIQIAKDSI